ncbi:MAG: PfaD family polyunsaturated fatty acid/polyketide biosynthesis protein [Deltaproteobacteria bacterium]|nr:MAG: PfaD family polyunsaturated fatty acid/polyketide biosynthesis protein [Deltaproteobacteria bacterium]
MTSEFRQKGWYLQGSTPAQPGVSGLTEAIEALHADVAVVRTPAGIGWASGGAPILTGPAPQPAGTQALPLLAWVGPLLPSDLGDPGFRSTYGVRACYVAGAMANGIGSEEVVIAMAKMGLMGFFGAAGLPVARIAQAIDRIRGEVPDLAVGFNLIHSPNDPGAEDATVDLFIQRGIRVVSASAYSKLTPALVRYRAAGLSEGAHGQVQIRHRILAKVSRPEVAEHFLRPAPARLLKALAEQGRITASQAALAAKVPMADDLTAEADSGGHTDRRPLPVLLPLLLALRDRVALQTGHRVRVGAAGGIGTPSAVAAAFSLGAAYVLTGTINQACVEAGTSPMVKAMLADAGAADVGMAPAGDMFEQGAEVQVLKRGTLFAQRGQKLRAWYRRYDSLDALDATERSELERILGEPVERVWASCVDFFESRDPAQLERAVRDPRHKMALIFRWYLGLSSRWAIGGVASRRVDTQIWCGPVIGAFNDWTRGTFLEDPAQRRVGVVAANLMSGAAAVLRARSLQQQGVDPGPAAAQWAPRPLSP